MFMQPNTFLQRDKKGLLYTYVLTKWKKKYTIFFSKPYNQFSKES